MILVGLTGGIGSGKSTIAKMFINLGVPVYFSDDHAKRLMITSKSVKSKLINEFGKDAYLNGKLNRSYIANIVFNDKEKLKAINAIVHPAVGNSFKRWTRKQQSDYVVQENAILFESGSYKKFDVLITVTAPKQLRVSRVVVRDKVSKEQVLERMNNQLPDKEKMEKSDFVIKNIDLAQTKKQVLNIHQKILEKLVSN